MYENLRRHAHASCLCVMVIFLGCNRAPDQTKITPGDGTKKEPVPGTQPVVEKPRRDDASANPPTVERTGEDVPQGRSYSLQRPDMLGTDQGSVHVYFLRLTPAADEEPFFVVWTDARGYSGVAGFPSAQNNPPRKHLSYGDLALRYGGKDNAYDRELKCSFEITVGEQGQFKIDGKTYDFAKGTLFVIAGQDGDVRVKQLSRPKLPSERNAVIALGKADPNIKEFFSKAAKPK